ncbi:MAG TPA: GAF domain-containing protein, partial [Candidatus Acidoferrales bacterium]|nr:GAF domain-containing protein [Candidatus Acidoferrales bacterium]
MDKGGSPIGRFHRFYLRPKALTSARWGLVLLAAAGLVALLALELRAPQALALAAAVGLALVVGALVAFNYLAAAGRSSGGRLQEQEHRLHELTLLLDAAQALGATLDADKILRAALRATVRGLAPAAGALDPQASFHAVAGETVRITQVEDELKAPVTGFEYELARNQAARAAIRIGRAAFVRPDHLSGKLLELAERQGWKVLIMAPVYSDKVLIGLLAAAPRDTEVVDRHRLRMLEVLARMTSLALGNAENFQRERQEVERVETRDRARSELFGQVSHELRELREPLASLRSQLRRLPAAAPLTPDRLAELENLIARLEAHAAVDGQTGLPLLEIGLAALERDLARSDRTLLGRHTVAYLN